MRTLTSTKTMIAVAILGLTMSFASLARGAPADAGPPPLDALSAPLTAAEIDPPEDVPEPVAPVLAITAAPESATPADAAPAVPTEVANPAEKDPIGTSKATLQMVKDGRYLAAFGGVLLFMVFLLRWSLIFFKVKWASTKPGGFLIAFATSLALALGVAWQAGAGFSLALLGGALSAAWLAAGQHGHIKDVLDWLRND